MNPSDAKQLSAQLLRVQCRDQHRLRTSLARARKQKDEKLITKVADDIAASVEVTQAFSQRSMVFEYPDALPISARKDEIKKAIEDNQILILAGATGSGKTTQLPKICLEAGLGCRGLIAHTQPRRLAARTVASRIADEIGCALGQRVGYQVRFKDESCESTQLKLMTDGVLLAEFQRDPWLSRYEVIIIDEAHERSLNIDFILGLLKPLLKKRADLKLIITSATIDLESFANYFSQGGKPAPVIEVSGRTFPVDVLYQDDDEQDRNANLETVIADTVATIVREEAAGGFKTSGDILVFCAGEREIRDAARAVRDLNMQIEVLPLYARLSVAEQNKVFRPSQLRKVVLATNVAETSITVPGIAYVIDPGVARVSQYNFRAKVQQLPISEISQASANQRMGRCGRVRNGVCFRLYSEDNFKARDAFTPAEILRSNLSSVILQMIRLGVKDPKHFDFLDQPDARLLNDGLKQLQELSAIDSAKKLTPTGRLMSDLPVDPQLARMLVEARDSEFLLDTIIVAAAQSMRDVQDSKPNNGSDDGAANRIAPQHPQSDFCTQLLLWQSIESNRKALSNKAFKALCEKQRWSIQRVFEWRDLVRQLKSMCTSIANKPIKWQSLELDRKVDEFKQQLDLQSSRYESLHRAIVAGFLANVLNRSIDGDYLGTRSRTITIGKDSSLKKTKAKWLVATQMMETNRLYARNVAVIRPEWILAFAQNYLKFEYSEPRFEKSRGNVTALRKTLYKGLTLKQGESCSYQKVDLQEARQIFIQEALVAAQYEPQRREIDFMQHNQDLIRSLEKYEVKMRRRTLAFGDQWLSDFYAERLPTDCANVQAMEKWLLAGGNNQLKLAIDQFIEPSEQKLIESSFPNHLTVQGKKLKLSYLFDPSSEYDGLTLHVPVELLAPLALNVGDWLVPGLLADKCAALIKTLPKPIRQNYTPANDAVARVLDQLKSQDAPLISVLGEALYKTRGTRIPQSAWNIDKLDAHLRMNYCLEDVDGSLIEMGRDLLSLKRRYADAVSERLHASQAEERKEFETRNVNGWRTKLHLQPISYRHQGMTVIAYPMHQRQPDGSIDLLLSESAKVAYFHNQLTLPDLILNELARTQTNTLSLLRKEVAQRLNQNQTQIKSRNQGLTGKVAGKTNSPSISNDQRNTKQAVHSTSGSGVPGSLAAQLKGLNLSTQQAKPKTLQARQSASKQSGGRLNKQVVDQGFSVELALRISIRAAVSSTPMPQSHTEFLHMVEHLDKHWSETALAVADHLRSAQLQQQSLLQTLLATKVTSIQADQALEDMKSQVYRLCDPQRLQLTSPADLQQYPRLFRALSQRITGLQEQTTLDKMHTPALYKWQSQHDSAIDRLCEPLRQQGLLQPSERILYAYIALPDISEFALMLEEWRVSLFAQQLKTRFSVSEQRVQRAWNALDTKIRANLEQI